MNKHRFLSALKRQPVDSTPIWMMRQAGRYLPEYRKIRQSAGSFLNLCTNAELACEVTLQPLQRFDFDAAILFSDILTIPDAMGLGLYFSEGEGPKFERPVRSMAEVQALPNISTNEHLSYVTDAISLIRHELNNKVPLIGFSGSPWTLATYMVEGRSTRDFSLIKTMLYNQPKCLQLLLDKLTEAVIEYLTAQAMAGAQVLQIFDTWGGVLNDHAYQHYSLVYMNKIVNAWRVNPATRDIPIILFTKNGGQWIESIAATGCDAVGLDWTTNLGVARGIINDSVALQGNMDPAILRADFKAIRNEVKRILDSYGQHKQGSGHIFNLGHGVTPDINPDNVKCFVDSVKDLSVDYH